MYQTLTYIQHPVKFNSVLPFILDVLPHLKVGDANPIEAVRFFMKRFKLFII
jgi:hypothetical protein